MGLKRGAVDLEPHDSSWRQRAEREADRLRDKAGDRLVAVEHVGSTAVEGIPAKPVLDLLAVVDPGTVDDASSSLANAGYERRANDGPDRVFLVRGPPDDRTHYLSGTERGSGSHRELVAFRDYLRTNPDRREGYAALQRELAAMYPADRRA